jgi:hypothetical protein
MKTHLAYIQKNLLQTYHNTVFFGLKKNSKQVNNSELSGFPPQTTSQACWRQPFYKGLLSMQIADFLGKM